MKDIKKHSAFVVPFFLLLILIIVYKSLDNFSIIKEYFFDTIEILKPFFIGFIVAYILNIPCKKIEAGLKKSKYAFIKNKSKAISILTVYLIALLIIFFGIRAFVPAIYKNVLDMYNNAPGYLQTIMGYIDMWQKRLNIQFLSIDNGGSAAKAIEGLIKSIDITQFSKYAQGVINLTSGVINIFISIIVSVYMLIDKKTIKKNLKTVCVVLFSEERTQKISAYLRRTNDIFSKYIYCRVIDALIIAVIATIALYIIGVKYALVLGVLIGFCNLIPYFGSIIGTIIAMIITLVTGGILKTVWVGISLLIIEQIDGNYIGPKIMGEMLEIRPLWVIFAVTVGGGLFGVAGMIFSVPVLVVVKMIGEDYIKEKQSKINTTNNNDLNAEGN